MLLLQCWLAAAGDGGAPDALSALLSALGGAPLLQAAGLAGGGAGGCPSAQALLAALSDAACRLGVEGGLRLLVMLLRDRTSGGARARRPPPPQRSPRPPGGLRTLPPACRHLITAA